MTDAASPAALNYLASLVNCTLGGKFYPIVHHFIEPEQILALVKHHGGEACRVPTPREHRRDENVTLALYFIEVEGRSWAWTQNRLGLNAVDLGVVRQRYLRFREACRPEDLAFLKTLKGVRD